MNVGIIIWSATGNTLLVAQIFKAALSAAGHMVTIEQIGIDSEEPARRTDPWNFTNQPDVTAYDALIFGSPVEAFSLSAVTLRFLQNLKTLSGKPFFSYVTQYFPKPWMGGTNAINQLKKLVEEQDGISCGSAVINWSSKKRVLQIETAKINLVKNWSRE